jgi:hypothetical protein
MSNLDIENHRMLFDFLQATGKVPAGTTMEAKTLAGGVSNRTVWVRLATGETWVLKQALAKLRVEADWFSDPVRIRREALAMRWLESLAPPGTITHLVFEEPDEHLLAMQAVPNPHVNWKTQLLAGKVHLEHVSDFARLLGVIHGRAWERRDELAAIFAERSFFESLRLEPYYEYTASQVPPAASFLGTLVAETRRELLTLVHGDYSPKNVLIHQGQLVLLDHEVAHWGDPAFDVGFALTHLLSKGHHLPALRDTFRQAANLFWRTYWLHVRPIWPDLEKRAAQHAAACLLARVAGRSPLEYLTEDERRRQRDAAIGLMLAQPQTVGDLMDQFLARVS